jgi:hypothetical protein
MSGPTLIFRWKGSGLKKRRSDVEVELRKEGWGSSLNDEQIDKLKYLEKKAAEVGREEPLFIQPTLIDKVK